MRICVVGAGAIGGAFGGEARAGGGRGLRRRPRRAASGDPPRRSQDDRGGRAVHRETRGARADRRPRPQDLLALAVRANCLAAGGTYGPARRRAEQQSDRPSYPLLTMLSRSTHRLCPAGVPVKYRAYNPSPSIVTESEPSYSETKHLLLSVGDAIDAWTKNPCFAEGRLYSPAQNRGIRPSRV